MNPLCVASMLQIKGILWSNLLWKIKDFASFKSVYNNGNQVENNVTIFYNNFHINSHRSPNKAHSNIAFTTPCKKEKTEHKNRARWSTIKDVAIFASYSFQYIPNLCKMPATTPQNVISANITYKRVPSLSEFQTWINKWFWIQLTW